MNLDELDIKVLKENFDEEDIKLLDENNVAQINRYLIDNGIYYAKDLFLSSMDLFLLPKDKFIGKFEILKQRLEDNYIDKLGEDLSLIEIMYE